MTQALEGVYYSYTAVATDPQNGTIVYSALTLPGWLSFDPATQQLAGMPLRGDVSCRGLDWFPVKDRCAQGGDYVVVLQASNYLVSVTQKFTIHITAAANPLVSIDRSFHWPNALELQIARQVIFPFTILPPSLI